MVGLGIIEFLFKSRLQGPKKPCKDCIETGNKLLPELTKQLGPAAVEAFNKFKAHEIDNNQFISILRQNYSKDQVENLVNTLLKESG